MKIAKILSRYMDIMNKHGVDSEQERKFFARYEKIVRLMRMYKRIKIALNREQ